MAKSNVKKAINLLIDEEDPKVRDNERHKLRYRFDKLPEATIRELEYEHARYKSRLRNTLKEE